MAHIQTSQVIPARFDEVFAYLISISQLPESLLDSLKLKVFGVAKRASLEKGRCYKIELDRLGIKMGGAIKIEELVENEKVELVQVDGLFRSYRHIAKVEEHGEGQTLLTDYIEYQLPLGIIGRLVDDLFLHNDIKKILESRYLRIIKYFQFKPKKDSQTKSKSDAAE